MGYVWKRSGWFVLKSADMTNLVNPHWDPSKTAYPPSAVEQEGSVKLVDNTSRAQLIRLMRAYLSTALVKGSAEVIRRWTIHCVPPQYLSDDTRRAFTARRDRLDRVPDGPAP